MAANKDTLLASHGTRVRTRRSLTVRFVTSILLISLVTGGIGLVLFEFITSDIRETLGRDFVGKQALYDKSSLELPIQREVALALKLASSPTLKEWSRSETDEALLLLVEDNRMNQVIVERLLRSRGVEVVLATDGVEALEQVDRSFDVVLMDLQMPRMNGFEATRELRKRFGFDELPIIAMSANAMELDRKLSREAGMNDHVAKPLEFDVFFRTLLAWVRVSESQRAGAPNQVQEVP